MKQCTKCGKYQPINNFAKCATSSDGYQLWCKICKHQYYLDNKEKCLEKSRHWAKENPKQNARMHTLSSRNNKEKHDMCNENWIANNPNKYRKIRAKHYATHRRHLGWNLIIPNPIAESEKIEYHHIDDNHVVAVPADLHRIYNGCDTDTHRENMHYIVEQLYKEGFLSQ